MSASLDLHKAFASHTFGDITQILTWVNDERAMVLVPTYRPGAPWFIVCDSAAYKYSDVRYLAAQAAKAAQVLGMGQSKSTAMKIATIILEGLPDLIRMPSAQPPELMAGGFGHMQLKADGQVLHEQEVRYEKEGVTYG